MPTQAALLEVIAKTRLLRPRGTSRPTARLAARHPGACPPLAVDASASAGTMGARARSDDTDPCRDRASDRGNDQTGAEASPPGPRSHSRLPTRRRHIDAVSQRALYGGSRERAHPGICVFAKPTGWPLGVSCAAGDCIARAGRCCTPRSAGGLSPKWRTHGVLAPRSLCGRVRRLFGELPSTPSAVPNERTRKGVAGLTPRSAFSVAAVALGGGGTSLQGRFHAFAGCPRLEPQSKGEDRLRK